MSARTETWLWMAQRLSAAVLALTVTVHLFTMVNAVRGGLDAAEIVGRIRGDAGWLTFYAVFVVAAAVHAPIGLRAVLAEATALPRAAVAAACAALALGMLMLGARAIWGLYT